MARRGVRGRSKKAILAQRSGDLGCVKYAGVRNDDGEQAPHPGLHIFLFVVFDTSAVILFVKCLCKLLLLVLNLLHVVCHK